MEKEKWLQVNMKPGLVAIGTVLAERYNGFGLSHDPVSLTGQRIE